MSDDSLKNLPTGREEFFKLLQTKEDLHPDLAEYLNEDEHFARLQHPLVYSVPHHPQMNAHLNRQYEEKKKALLKAMQDGKWASAVFLYEKPWRTEALERFMFHIEDHEQFWKLVGDVWTNSENVWQNFQRWRTIWNIKRPHREAAMDEDERKVFDSLPNRIKVWRGINPDVDENGSDGLSWTLDRDKAKWFAKRFSQSHGKILTKVIEKPKAVAYFASRQESEIVTIGK
jgi:hypothetical protein